MKRSFLSILAAFILPLSMCIALSSCQKKDAPVTNAANAATQTNAPKKGDEVTFGSYPQTVSNAEPLVWIVLDVDTANHTMFLLSKYVIDAKPYQTNSAPVTWETSSIRAWLNGEFLNSAFTSSEKDRIQTTHLENPDNVFYDVDGGNDTDDKVFLLSLADVWHEDPSVPNSGKYFTGPAYKQVFQINEERIALVTSYAIRQGANTNNLSGSSECANIQCYSLWWLRTPGLNLRSATYVDLFGNVSNFGEPFNSSDLGDIGVRPAMWVKY